MKYSILLLASLAATGCATSSGTDDDGGINEDAAVTPDAAKVDAAKKDSAVDPCQTEVCTSDSDCDNVCPPVMNGSNCCDTSTGICYAYNALSCPEPVVDAGTD